MENKKVSIQELVDVVASQADFTKKFTEEFLRELVHVMQEYLEKDGIVKVKGLGTFKMVRNEERKSVHVTTGEPIFIAAHNKLTFTPDSELKEKVNKPYAHLETVSIPLNTTEPTEQIVQENIAVANETTASQNKEELSTKNEREPIAPATEKEDESTSATLQEKPKRKKLIKGVVPVTILVVFHILILVATYFYKTEIYAFTHQLWENVDAHFNPSEQKLVDENAFILEIQPVEEPIVELIEDTVAIADIEPIIEEQVYSSAIAQQAPIKEYITVNEGSRLTWIAYKVYGHKAFWVYIYDANRFQLNTPNDVQSGMKLAIPDMDPSLINPNDEECIRKALDLAQFYK